MPVPFDPLGYIPGVNLDDARFGADELLAAETLAAQAVEARFPTLDVSENSTFYELLRPQALLYLTSKTQVRAALATLSLAAVRDNPALASDAVVDALLSNWGIVRAPGAAAAGLVRVMVGRNAVYALPAGQQFVTVQGQIFETQEALVALETPTAEGQLKLYPADALGDQWYFLVPAVAQSSGLASQIASGVALDPQPSIPNLIACFSFGEFSGAVDGESAADLIARLPDGLSAKNYLSRAALRGAVRTAYPDLQSLAVQGFGDPALLRGGDNIFGIKTPGRADVWVRTLPGLESRASSCLATQVSFNADGSAIYSVTLTAAQTRGAYLVAAVLPPDDDVSLGTYPLLSQSYGFEPAGARVASAAEAAFSAWSTLTCLFLVSPSDRALDATLDVRVRTIGQPHVPEIQAMLDAPDTRAACADYLVRAAIPCFCSLSPVTVYADASVDPAELRTALYRTIVRTDPGEPLRVDALVLALRQIAGVSRVDLPVRLAGRIYCPDGSTIELQSQNALIIPNRPAQQVVPETVAWFVSAEDIALNVIFSS